MGFGLCVCAYDKKINYLVYFIYLHVLCIFCTIQQTNIKTRAQNMSKTYLPDVSYKTRLINRYPEFQDRLLYLNLLVLSQKTHELQINNLISYRDRYGHLTLGLVINKLPRNFHCIVLPLADIPTQCSFLTQIEPNDNSNKMEFLEAFLELIRVNQIQSIHENNNIQDINKLLETYRNTQMLPMPNVYFSESKNIEDSRQYQNILEQQQHHNRLLALHHSGISHPGSIIL